MTRRGEGRCGVPEVVGCSRQTRLASFAGIRRILLTADQVGRFTVFNIRGNKVRLVAAVRYNRGTVYIRNVLTHAEYDRGRWKD